MYQCCRTTTPSYPLSCAAPTLLAETCAPSISCAVGTLVNGRCLLRPGGVSACPPGGKQCMCGKGTKNGISFCATTQRLFGSDACQVACALDTIPRLACPVNAPYANAATAYGQRA